MKIRFMSDLHLNFSSFEVPPHPDDKDTVLVLAGDVCEVPHGKTVYVPFFEDVCARFKVVLYVFGNHEHYDTSYVRTYDKFMRECGHLDNLKVLEQDVVDIDDVSFIGCTLWTDFDGGNPMTMESARTSMNDYHLIRMGPLGSPYQMRLRPVDTLKDHYVMRNFIFEEVIAAKLDNRKTVVITHHHPSFMSVSDEFRGDVLNGCYCTDLFDQVYDNGPDLWFCGHIHDRKDYMINKTRILCNPRGYHSPAGSYRMSYAQETGFDPEAFVEI